MEWFVPLSIIPGAGLIIMSTSQTMISLNDEITSLVNRGNESVNIIKEKLLQLKRLSVSIVFQYIGVFLLLISGLSVNLLASLKLLSDWLLLIGVIAISISILYLIIYSIRAVSIRQKHLAQ
ncbi:MAG: hypothetical protein QM503_09110 [Bacteroidota bacterium]